MITGSAPATGPAWLNNYPLIGPALAQWVNAGLHALVTQAEHDPGELPCISEKPA